MFACKHALAPAIIFLGAISVTAQPATNSCPVDGCVITIEAAAKEGDEIRLTFNANFLPNFSKNHLHVWWGDTYEVRQVSANAEGTYGVTQGIWHPTDSYPDYVTSSVISTSVRGGATTLCVTAGDRNHEILDPDFSDCKDVSELLAD